MTPICNECGCFYDPQSETVHRCVLGDRLKYIMEKPVAIRSITDELEGEFQVCWKSAKGEFNSTSPNFNTYQKAVSEAEFRVKMNGSALGELYIVQLVAVVKLKREATVEDRR